METFFAEALRINPEADKITGKIRGVPVEAIDDPTMKNIRRPGKLVDDLAKGRAKALALAGEGRDEHKDN
jgi:hypothetical protein